VRFWAFGLLCTTIYWLLARAEISKPLWSRYRGFLDRLARCPACSGTWLGIAVAFAEPPPYVGNGSIWEKAVWGALSGMFLTPLGMMVLKAALTYTNLGQNGQPDNSPED
jgi:hypothetical protein